MAERLTSLNAVKNWIGIDPSNTDSDAQLTQIIDAASQFILNYVNQDSFAARDFTQNFRGNGKNKMILRNWPVISVSSVGIGGSLVSASTLGTGGLPGSGYTISDFHSAAQWIELYGYSFSYGAPSQVVYRAGFETTQAMTIPNASPYQLSTTAGGQWTTGVSVTKNGTLMTQVAANPAAGQYSIDSWGVYTFAAADANQPVVIKFGYAPPDVVFATTQLIGEWFAKKDRIGLLSKSLGGQETVSFYQGDMSSTVQSMLQPYVQVVPL